MKFNLFLTGDDPHIARQASVQLVPAHTRTQGPYRSQLQFLRHHFSLRHCTKSATRLEEQVCTLFQLWSSFNIYSPRSLAQRLQCSWIGWLECRLYVYVVQKFTGSSPVLPTNFDISSIYLVRVCYVFLSVLKGYSS